SNKFINTMTQKPNIDQLLPLASLDAGETPRKGLWDYLYEPDAQQLLDALLVRFIESQVYQGGVENGAAEQAARMIAMKSATDTAGELISDLQLVYNNARQAAITQETSEIVRHAAAVQERFKYSDEPNMSSGRIVQIIGAVIDVEFPRDQVPDVYDELTVHGAATTLEV